jgi:N-acetylmuramoyl-L-alanine amidase
MKPHTKEIDRLVIHHSASDPSKTSVSDIKRWHVEERGWDAIGYHHVITAHGLLEYTRPIHLQGAHTQGHNNGTLGVCVIGDNTIPEHRWNHFQMRALFNHYDAVLRLFPNIKVYGHKDLSSKTECPGIDVRSILLGPRSTENGYA